MTELWAIGLGLVGAVIGAAIGYLGIRLATGGASARADQILRDADAERDRIQKAAEVDAKARVLALSADHEREVKRERDELGERERQLREREAGALRQSQVVQERERALGSRETALAASELAAHKQLAQAQGQLDESNRRLERVAGLSRSDARDELVRSIEAEARHEAAARVQRLEDDARRDAEERARRLIAAAIQRFAGGYVAEKTVSVVELPSDDMKGRIIGREGRNIRAIEQVTGADVIIDDTPEVVVVSAFNPIRREIARRALERLVADGRIHPARIEEVVEQVTVEIDQVIMSAGEQATFDLGLHGMHPELVKLVGKLRFRVVNGQNLWNHAVETAAICGTVAAELGADANLARRAGLLHDIGKAVEHETAGDHAAIGAEQARRYGEAAAVVEAIRTYHDSAPRSLLGVLLQVADGASKARPGARRDSLDSYVKRLEDLERISMAFKGVEKAYAIQAGREVRVMVNFETVSDADALLLSNDIARRIQDTLTYPGEVRVTVIREARATEIAR